MHAAVMKMQLAPFLENQFPPYRESYNTQHVLIRLLEEQRKNICINFLVGGAFMDLSKAFDFLLMIC